MLSCARPRLPFLRPCASSAPQRGSPARPPSREPSTGPDQPGIYQPARSPCGVVTAEPRCCCGINRGGLQSRPAAPLASLWQRTRVVPTCGSPPHRGVRPAVPRHRTAGSVCQSGEDTGWRHAVAAIFISSHLPPQPAVLASLPQLARAGSCPLVPPCPINWVPAAPSPRQSQPPLTGADGCKAWSTAPPKHPLLRWVAMQNDASPAHPTQLPCHPWGQGVRHRAPSQPQRCPAAGAGCRAEPCRVVPSRAERRHRTIPPLSQPPLPPPAPAICNRSALPSSPPGPMLPRSGGHRAPLPCQLGRVCPHTASPPGTPGPPRCGVPG